MRTILKVRGDSIQKESPLGAAEPRDPVKLFNVLGFNLCGDSGEAGCSLFFHAGLSGSNDRKGAERARAM